MWGESGEWGKEAVRLMPVWEATVIAKPTHLIVGKVPAWFLTGYVCLGKLLELSESLSFCDMGKIQRKKVWKAPGTQYTLGKCYSFCLPLLLT